MDNVPTVILRNGVIIRYVPNYLNDIGWFIIDVNGNDKPNIAGRDYFGFLISQKGKVIDYSAGLNEKKTLKYKIEQCTKTTQLMYCYGAIVDNNWKIPY